MNNKFFILLFLSLLLVGSASATNWYVDNAVASSGNGQSWSSAWKAFSNIAWSSIQPGDTIYISGGTTSKIYTETLTPGKSGIAGNPITIRNAIDGGHNGVVIIDGQEILESCIYMRPKSYLTFSGFKLRGFTSKAIDIEGAWPYSTSGASKSIVIENMDIFIDQGRGIFIQTSDDIIVRNTRISTVGYSESQTDGIYSQYNMRPIFENNYIVISNTETTGHDDCIQSVNDTDLVARGNFVWQNNSKNSNAQGIYATQGTGTFKYYNNVYYSGNSSSNGITFRRLGATGTIEMIGNTAYGERSISLFVITEVPDPVFKNNIAYSKSPYGAGVKISNWAGNPSNIDYNVLYAPNSNSVYTVDSSSKSWSYTRGLGWDEHSYNANPLFINLAAMDYHLQAGSPAIDHGLTTSVYSKDKDGVSRPQGAGYDIGAYEYVSGSVQYHPADTNQDGCVSLGEISSYVGKWLNGEITLGAVSSGVSEWLGGC